MADPAELLKLWQRAIRDLGGTASLASTPVGAAGDVLRPLQHQAELLEQVLQRQLEFERELLGRAVAPLHAAQELVDQASETWRGQASSFRAASKTFGQLAGLMDQQAHLLERAGATMRDPLAVFRTTGDAVPAETQGAGAKSTKTADESRQRRNQTPPQGSDLQDKRT